MNFQFFSLSLSLIHYVIYYLSRKTKLFLFMRIYVYHHQSLIIDCLEYNKYYLIKTLNLIINIIMTLFQFNLKQISVLMKIIKKKFILLTNNRNA